MLGFAALAASSASSLAWGLTTAATVLLALVLWFVLLAFAALIKQVNG